MKRRDCLWLAVAPMGSVLSACSTAPENVDTKASDLSVVAGHIDMRDAPTRLGWVSIKAYGPGTDFHYRARVEDGFFFHIGVDPGSYQIDRFGGKSSWSLAGGVAHEYEWGTTGRNPTAVRIERPGVYFLGSYRYRAQSSGIFEQGKFEMVRAESPSELVVLQRVLGIVQSDPSLKQYEMQIQRLRRAIAEAGGAKA